MPRTPLIVPQIFNLYHTLLNPIQVISAVLIHRRAGLRQRNSLFTFVLMFGHFFFRPSFFHASKMSIYMGGTCSFLTFNKGIVRTWSPLEVWSKFSMKYLTRREVSLRSLAFFIIILVNHCSFNAVIFSLRSGSLLKCSLFFWTLTD